MSPSFTIRQLTADDATAYRELRLAGLKGDPRAFTAAWEDEIDYPLEVHRSRITDNYVLGGFLDGGKLCGVAGLMVPKGAKVRHRGTLWGVYVTPDARGLGLAAALVSGVVEKARTVVEVLTLGVGTYNVSDQRVYLAAGFVEHAREAGLIKIGDEYVDEILMSISFRDH